jgi:RNA polymerase sigma factor (sigma-70 family)
MEEDQSLTARFEAERPRLVAVAYRILGSLSEAEDAVQEAWLRLERTAAHEIDDLAAWLTTVVARVALNLLRSRKVRGEAPIETVMLDDADGPSPERAALLADTLGVAMLVVLETLPPPERVAFVLHDIFALPFDQIAAIVERSPEAARQLASRARRRLSARNAAADDDLEAQRSVVDAFRAAADDGDFHRLVAVLDPDVVLRADFGAPTAASAVEVRGAAEVARRAGSFSQLGVERRLALIDGTPGLLCTVDGKLFSAMAFTVKAGKIATIDILRDPARLAALSIG